MSLNGWHSVNWDTLKNWLAVSTQVEYLHSLGPSNSTPKYILNSSVFLCSLKDVGWIVHSSVVGNSPKLETE